jgi:hypothetical protein
VNAVPVVTLPASVNVNFGNSYTIAPAVGGGSGNYTYYYNGVAGGSTLSVTPSDTITYLVEVYDGNNCMGSASITLNVIFATGDISGYVTYKNAAGTPMTNTVVYLKKNGSTIASTTTNSNGYYQFLNQFVGTYTVVAAPNKPWGGGNSNDALLVLKDFIGTDPLFGLYKLAGDVDGNTANNADDALLIAQRFVTIVNTFTVGDWISEENTVVIPVLGGPVANNFGVLCYGDVNGSYTPLVKQTPTINMNQSGVKEIQSYTEFELPINIAQANEVGAISLVLDYPESAVEVVDVLLGDASASDLVYTDINGVLRISWYNTTARDLSANDALVTLKMRAKDLQYVAGETISIISTEESQLGDGNATVLRNVTLNIPKLVVANDEYSISVYPNPFENNTQIVYTLPEDGKVTLRVFNALGEQVKTIANSLLQSAGTYHVDFDASTLTPGTYSYRIEVAGESRTFIETGMMVLTR